MISFIIPAKNEEGYIAGCLASIVAQETTEPFEIIVVDNGSIDATQNIIREKYPSTKIITEQKPGTSAARQGGFLQAQGEVLIFLDGDVRLPDRLWLTRVLNTINSPGVVAVSSHYRYYGASAFQSFLQTFGTFVFVYPWIFLTNHILHHSGHMVGGIMAIKKAGLARVGGFDTQTEFFGDETLIAKKLYNQGKIVVSPKVWVWTSGRRYKQQGMVKTVYKYVLNYFWALLTGSPFHKTV